MDNNNTIVMPGHDNTGADMLKQSNALASDREKVKDAISGREVDIVIIPKEKTIDPKNYLLYIANCKLNPIQTGVLKMLTVKNSDIDAINQIDEEDRVTVYLYNKNKGILNIGIGNDRQLSRLLPLIKKYDFDDKIHIYVNVDAGKPLKELNEVNFSKFRLRI